MSRLGSIFLLIIAESATHSIQAQVRSQIDALLRDVPSKVPKATTKDKKQLMANTILMIDDLSRDRLLIQEAVSAAKRKIPNRESIASILLQARYTSLCSSMNSFLLNLQNAQAQSGPQRIMISEAAIDIDKSFDSLKIALSQIMPKELVVRRIRAALLLELASQMSPPSKKNEIKDRNLLFGQLRESLQFVPWESL
jgi:hypothetical protein